MFKNKKVLFTISALVAALLLPSMASASQLAQASLRLGRLGNGATANNDALVTFKLNSSPTSVAQIIVTFPSGFTITAGNPTVSTSNFPATPASITAPPGTLSALAASNGAGLGGTITVSGFTSANLNTTTLYGFDVAAGTITNPSTAGQYNDSVASANSSGTPIDTTSTPTYIYGTAPNQDQIVVNASVAPSFTFSLSANTDTVPKVDPTAIQTSPGVTMLVSTNSPLGYTAYVSSSNAALRSATQPTTPITTGTYNGTTPDTLAPGITDYTFVPTTGVACSSCTGVLTYNGAYAISDGTHGGAFNTAGSFAPFVSRSGYSNGDTISLKERVSVANTIAYANDYTDTLTVVAAGNY